MTKARTLLAVLLMLGVMLVSLPGHSYADVNNFVINDFAVDETISQATPHGHLDITEQIKVTYSDNNHGLLRALPATYHGRPLQLHILSVTSPSGAPAQYTISGSNDNTVLKIGSPSSTVTGLQSYVIHYSYDNVMTFYKDHDELYWDVNGDQWQQIIQHVSVALHAPANSPVQAGPRCFAGSYGQTDAACTVAATSDGGLTAEASNLGPKQTLTYVAAFKTGSFAPYTASDQVKQYKPLLAKLLFLPLISLLIFYPLWRKKGRDAPGRGTIIAQYEPYEGLKPIEIGTIMDFKVDNRDITATIIYLAVHKYLKIIEQRQDHLIGKDTLVYSLQLVNNDTTQLADFERTVLIAIFPGLLINEETILASNNRAGGAFYEMANNLRQSVTKQLTAAGYFKNNPAAVSVWVAAALLLLMIAVFLGSIAFGLIWFIGGALALIIAGIFVSKMSARTALGVEAFEHSRGLQLFLTVTEAERFKKTQSPNAAYADNNEPVKTVELFEKLLPYAVALGVETGWAAQCNNLYTQAPDWYSGNLNTFSAVYLASNLQSSFGSQINSSFAAPSSSNSSGFGGGGFSGGGGGGGGGGGW